MLEAKTLNEKDSETFNLSLNGKKIKITLNIKLDYVLISTIDFNDITLIGAFDNLYCYDINGKNWSIEYNPRIEMLEIINQKKEEAE